MAGDDQSLLDAVEKVFTTGDVAGWIEFVMSSGAVPEHQRRRLADAAVGKVVRPMSDAGRKRAEKHAMLHQIWAANEQLKADGVQPVATRAVRLGVMFPRGVWAPLGLTSILRCITKSKRELLGEPPRRRHRK